MAVSDDGDTLVRVIINTLLLSENDLVSCVEM